MKNTIATSKSAWLNPKNSNNFRYELALAKDNYRANPAFVWLHQNCAEELLHSTLSCLAPLRPVSGYKGETASWVSQPPSGAGNAIYLVVGKDGAGHVRAVGGNYFGRPDSFLKPSLVPLGELGKQSIGAKFFSAYDSHSQDLKQQQGLVHEQVRSCMNEDLVQQVECMCSMFYAMPIYLVVLTDTCSLFYCGPAVVDGRRQADFSLEVFGEFTA